MNIQLVSGNDSLAKVYVAEFANNKTIEFVESIQPPFPREQKWVLIVSTLAGCPVNCPICDAGGFYKGKLSADEILSQIDYLITNRFPDRFVPVKKFKIQFARMGDPAFNLNVIDVLKKLPSRYDAPGLMPCISTIAPRGTGRFFEQLLEIKQDLYKNRFQMQFSVHSTNGEQRDRLIPVRKWEFQDIAEYGNRFYQTGDRKIALNFALAQDSEISPDILLKYFSPDIFIIKLTPVNPTYSSMINNIESYIQDNNGNNDIIESIKAAGYEVLISIGELKENDIGSNCGQYVMRHLNSQNKLPGAYSGSNLMAPE